ncbi:MAG: response regulator transcription factor [Propionibacteriales bacterium]|nr:response regulator transcription factor [Propionibacteriales bacterium]
MIQVVVADDQAMVRSGLISLLEDTADICVVGEASDGAEAVRVAQRHRPHVVLMDIRMPVLDGISATRRISDLLPETQVITLTTFDLDEYVFEALRAGAAGFLLKDATADQLVDGIRTVAAGHGLLSPDLTRRVIEAFAATRAADPDLYQRRQALSPREQDVLRHLAQGLTNAEVARILHLGESTVKTHVSNVLTKLDLRDRVQAVIYAYESGLVGLGQRADPE